VEYSRQWGNSNKTDAQRSKNLGHRKGEQKLLAAKKILCKGGVNKKKKYDKPVFGKGGGGQKVN